jgi:GNAT superfamily N-acetyltransferase
MTTDPLVELTDQPTPAFDSLMSAGLNSYNDAITGYADRQPLAVIVRDAATGAALGGLSGRTSLGLLFIDMVYLPPQARGRNTGRRMLAMAEQEARRRGCTSAVLYTITFQAPDFYAKHGYQEFGRIPCAPPGTARVFMTKDLTAA